jgi:hypothetical protein
MSVAWKSIAAEDARLRTAAEKAGEALARLRYENTLAIGVSFVEYAKHCGVAESNVRRYALAHQRLVENESHGSAESAESFDEAMVRATNSADRAAVVEAVAVVEGVTLRTADNGQHRQTVARVKQLATAAAERKGTSVAEEAPRAARVVAGSRQAEKRLREVKNAMPAYFVVIDNHLAKARLALTAALNDSHDIDWDDEAREMIVEALGKVKAIIGLLDMRFEGLADVDWDGELARIAD